MNSLLSLNGNPEQQHAAPEKRSGMAKVARYIGGVLAGIAGIVGAENKSFAQVVYGPVPAKDCNCPSKTNGVPYVAGVHAETFAKKTDPVLPQTTNAPAQTIADPKPKCEPSVVITYGPTSLKSFTEAGGKVAIDKSVGVPGVEYIGTGAEDVKRAFTAAESRNKSLIDPVVAAAKYVTDAPIVVPRITRVTINNRTVEFCNGKIINFDASPKGPSCQTTAWSGGKCNCGQKH